MRLKLSDTGDLNQNRIYPILVIERVGKVSSFAQKVDIVTLVVAISYADPHCFAVRVFNINIQPEAVDSVYRIKKCTV